MDSKYAYVNYIKSIKSGDVTANGEIVQLNYNINEGQKELIGISEYERLQRDFPDCIKGHIVKQEDLFNTIGECYDEIRDTAKAVAEKDEYIGAQIEFFEDAYSYAQIKQNDERIVEDLASKYFYLQEKVHRAEDRMFKEVNIQK